MENSAGGSAFAIPGVVARSTDTAPAAGESPHSQRKILSFEGREFSETR